MVDNLAIIAKTAQALYYGYKLTKEIYDEYRDYSTIIFGKDKISIEFYLVIRFKEGFQPNLIELESRLRKQLSGLNFDPRTNLIKINKDNVEYKLAILYWMFIQYIPDIDMIDEEIEEEDFVDENFVKDLTICSIPKIDDLDTKHKKKVLFLSKKILEEIGKKIQENYNTLPWSVKLTIKSNNKQTLKKLLEEIEDKLENTSARSSEPEENIDGEAMVNVWNVDTAYIEALNKVIFKRPIKTLLNRLRG